MRRLKTPPENGCRLPLPLEAPQHELDVLARTERICREVCARTVALARLRAADRHTVPARVLWVADLEIGEHGFRADVRQLKPLFPSELPPQFTLPRLERHLGRLAAV